MAQTRETMTNGVDVRPAGLIMRAALRVLLNGYDYLVLYLGLAWLGILCLAWTPIAMIIYPLLSERRGRALGRYAIMAVFRIYLASLSVSRRFSFDLEALDVLRDEPSLIIAPNHPCLLDAVMVISVSYTHLRAHETVLDLVC